MSEYATRLARARKMLGEVGLDGLLLTTEPEIRYFTGFLTRFWESPTRPWYLLVPQSGEPVAVIPSIGAALMRKTWPGAIRSWNAPDLDDDGTGLLADTITEVFGKNALLGVPAGHESHLRMPLDDFFRLRETIAPTRIENDRGIIRALRMVKSAAEIAKIKTACAIGGRAFARVNSIATPGTPLGTVFRRFQQLCLEEGADWVPYLAGGSGRLGYDDVISPADDTPLADGHVLMLDTGLIHDGYFCDFDRNYAIGTTPPAPEVTAAWQRLLDAAEAGCAASKPGALACDIFAAMDRVLTGGKGGVDSGRLGHGLGMQLTEWPSIAPSDLTEITEGMVLTIEPSITMPGGSVLVHEDNFAITAGGPQRLTPPAPATL